MRTSQFQSFILAAVVAATALFPGIGVARELLAVGTHFARVFERTQSGEYVGLGPEVVRAVARQLGDTVRFEIYPWVRAQAMIEHGEADILVGPYKTPERELRMAFSERGFYRDQMLFYARAESKLQWDGDYASLQGQRIAAVFGWAYGSSFDQARSMLHIGSANTLENGLQMLAHGRIDLLVTNSRNTEAALQGMNLGGTVVPLKRIIDVQDGYFAFPRRVDHDGLRVKFNRAFNNMVEQGELARLAGKLGVNIP